MKQIVHIAILNVLVAFRAARYGAKRVAAERKSCVEGGRVGKVCRGWCCWIEEEGKVGGSGFVAARWTISQAETPYPSPDLQYRILNSGLWDALLIVFLDARYQKRVRGNDV